MKALGIAKRNILIFFRDKTAVFFSLLSALIIIALYVLFLRNFNFAGDSETGKKISDVWIMGGVVGITTLTACIGSLEIMVTDGANKLVKDFYSSPITRKELTLGYILSSVIVGCLMSLVSLIFAQIYIVAYGGDFIAPLALIKVLGIIFLSVISSSSMMFFLVTFIKSTNAFGVSSTIIGTFVGFLSGTYMPVGVLPSAAQYFVKLFPISHSVLLIRKVMMGDLVNVYMPEIGAATQFNEQMGMAFKFGSYTLSPFISIAFLLLSAALFYGLAVLKLSKKKD